MPPTPFAGNHADWVPLIWIAGAVPVPIALERGAELSGCPELAAELLEPC